jgi:hypothetical protein
VEEFLEAAFSVQSATRLYNENQLDELVAKYKRLKLGGGQAYDCSSD